MKYGRVLWRWRSNFINYFFCFYSSNLHNLHLPNVLQSSIDQSDRKFKIQRHKSDILHRQTIHGTLHPSTAVWQYYNNNSNYKENQPIKSHLLSLYIYITLCFNLIPYTFGRLTVGDRFNHAACGYLYPTYARPAPRTIMIYHDQTTHCFFY